LLIIYYVFFSTKLVIRAEQVLTGMHGVGTEGGEQEARGKIAQIMYAHVNK
jgi:hypothetical protein